MNATLEDISERYDHVYPDFKRMLKEHYSDDDGWNSYAQKEDALNRMRSLNRKLQKVTLDET